MMCCTFHQDELHDVAPRLLEYASQRRVWALHGDMGSGKTTLCQALAQVLGSPDTVSSPTFSLVQEYQLPQTIQPPLIYHMDLYRITELEEALNIGIEDYLYSGAYCWIEWPERIAPLLPADTLHVQLYVLEDNRRKIVILPDTDQ